MPAPRTALGTDPMNDRSRLNPREMVHIDSADNESLNLQCGDKAENLAVVDTKYIAAGAAN